MNGNGYESSEEEDKVDEKWKAAIKSAAAAADFMFSTENGCAKADKESATTNAIPQNKAEESEGLKLYQTRAQKILNDMLEESLEFVTDHSPASGNPTQSNEGVIRLFRKAPPGIIFEPRDTYQRPTKRPHILPKAEINEKSKEFGHRIQRAAIEGTTILANAEKNAKQSLARYESRSKEAMATLKREDERVAALKKLRGEKWLPSIAREMQLRFQSPIAKNTIGKSLAKVNGGR